MALYNGTYLVIGFNKETNQRVELGANFPTKEKACAWLAAHYNVDTTGEDPYIDQNDPHILYIIRLDV